MAPATIAGASRARTGREPQWTRTKIIERIQRWHELYDEAPRAADWNPSSARWSGQAWRIERYRAGDPETGEAWPSLNAAKGPFGGSLVAAVRAAGLEPARPGPKRRAAVAPEGAERLDMHPDARVALQAALAQAAEATERLAARDEQLARAREQLRARGPGRGTEETARLGAAQARAQVAEARRDATRLAARLERAEADQTALRAERRELARRLAAAEDARAVPRARPLSAGDLGALCSAGPCGPAVLAAALDELARARRTNNPTRLEAALTAVARAAVSWRERL